MEVNIDELINQMLTAIKLSVKEDWQMISDTAQSFLQRKKDRLKLLTSLRLSNQVSHEFFITRLQDEQHLLESEILSLEIVSKVAVQNAANAAFLVVTKTVSKLIDHII
jgi:hypothetical protein